MGEKDCTLALNFGKENFGDLIILTFFHYINCASGGASDDEDNVPAKVYEQPELKQPDPTLLILEAHIHANPKPKVTWLCNGDFIKESDRKHSRLEPRPGEKNKWNAVLTIQVQRYVMHSQLRLAQNSFALPYCDCGVSQYA